MKNRLMLSYGVHLAEATCINLCRRDQRCLNRRCVVRTISLLPAAALLFLAEVRGASAGFFGTFCPGPDPCELPEPSSLALFAIGGAVAAAAYLKNRKRDK